MIFVVGFLFLFRIDLMVVRFCLILFIDNDDIGDCRKLKFFG